jgi:hypothetical protein
MFAVYSGQPAIRVPMKEIGKYLSQCDGVHLRVIRFKGQAKTFRVPDIKRSCIGTTETEEGAVALALNHIGEGDAPPSYPRWGVAKEVLLTRYESRRIGLLNLLQEIEPPLCPSGARRLLANFIQETVDKCS